LLPTFTPSDPAEATRTSSKTVLSAITDNLPELIGGSADLSGSTQTLWPNATKFQHPSTNFGDYSGRYIHFGVREHGMTAICNGIAAYGTIIPFCATFLNFISYAMGSIRLSAFSKHHVIFVLTHDSIGLGEDGPTHQPIETVAFLRAIPGFVTIRPCDGNEVLGACWAALEVSGPVGIVLSRQKLPQLEGTKFDLVLKGAYVLGKEENPNVVLVGTGSEVSLVVDAKKELVKDNVKATVVSMPSWELFENQSFDYRKSVFPDGVPVVSVEALTTLGWKKYAHSTIGVDSFGMSGPGKFSQ
jgi:transketolase